jgi:oligopeptide transport system ATP-binding protein
MQIIFQDPGGSLNSRMRVGTIVGEPLLVHGMASGESLRRRVEQLLELCGLEPDAASRYPHAFSGGQKQRIAIARAISTEPSLVVCDEPTSALDVSVQASIINLLASLQERTGVSYLFITHDLAVARHLCDEVALMESGQIKSCGPVDQVLEEARAQYSKSI